MNLPLQITYRNMEPSDTIEAAVRAKVAKLEEVAPRITSCRVMIEKPHRSHTKGGHFHVRVDLTMPGAEIVADRDPPKHDSHADFDIALRDAFRAARREYEHFNGRRQQHH